MTLLVFISGLGLLIIGAELLVRGASRLAVALGIPPLIIGLTVVAFGTSSPEIAVSVMSGLSGSGDIALGNIVGSNICNILLILGLSAAILPLVVARQLLILDVPLMIGASVLVWVLGSDGSIGRVDAGILLAILGAYLLLLILKTRNSASNNHLPVVTGKPIKLKPSLKGSLALNLLMIAGGLTLLVFGSRFLVTSAVTVAHALGVSELIIGLTVIAVGTSLPEVATSVMASIRQQRDIAVGNVIGSNIFNLLAVLGIAGFVVPRGIPVPSGALSFDLPVMIAVALICLPIFLTDKRIARWEGILFLSYYVLYNLFLFLAASKHRALASFTTAMLWFILPLTLLTLVILWWPKRRGLDALSTRG